MKETTKAALRLWSELNTIAKANGIPCIAGGLSVRGLMDKKNYEFPEMTAYVRDEDLANLRSLLESCLGPDRDLEGDVPFRYVDKTTVLLLLDDLAAHEKPGVAIEVRLLSADRIQESMLTGAEELVYMDHVLLVPRNLSDYHDLLFCDPDKGTTQYPSYGSAKCLATAQISYLDLPLDHLDLPALAETIASQQRIIDECSAAIDPLNARIDSALDEIQKIISA